MRTLIGWTAGAACATVIVAGLSALPAPAQDVRAQELKKDRRDLRLDTREIGGDRKDVAKDTHEVRQDRKGLETSRQQLRDAYKSGDPAAIKAARQNFQKSRGELRGDAKDRRQDVRDLRQDKEARRDDARDLRQDRRALGSEPTK